MPPSASSSAIDGDASAATATSVSRTRAGKAPNRWATTARRLSGSSTSASSARIEPSTSARPSSSAKNGFPPVIEWTRTITGRGTAIPNRPHSSRWIAPTESGSIAKPPERGEGAVEFERHLDGPPTHRRENGHRLGVQPSQHEREHLRRAGVEPLGIVQRDEHRALLGQRPHDRKQREPEDARVGKHARPAPESATRSREHAVAPAPAAAARHSEPGRADRQRPRRRPAPPTGSGATAARGSRAHPRRAAPPARERSSRSRHRPPSSNACPPAGTASRNDSSASSSSRLPMISAAIAPFPSRDPTPAGAPSTSVRADIVDPPGPTAIDRARKRDGQRAERVPNGVPNSADLGAQYPTKPDKAGLRRPENGETRPAHRRSTDSSRSTYWVRWRGPRKRSRTRLWASSPMRSAACGSSNNAVTRSPNA